MKRLMLVCTLFLLQPNINKPLTYKHCSIDNIVLSQGNHDLRVKLFNVFLETEAAHQYVCDQLANAKEIRIELDPNIQQEAITSAYIFCDGVLLQQQLLQKKLAKIEIRNPEYTYEQVMEQSEQPIQKVVAPPTKQTQSKKGFVAKIYFMIVLLIYCIIIAYFIYNHQHQHR